jgi:hypothetical protein
LATAAFHDGLGLGTDVVLTGQRIVGNALAWEEGVVHSRFFPRPTIAPAQRPERLGSRPQPEGAALPLRRRQLGVGLANLLPAVLLFLEPSGPLDALRQLRCSRREV